MIGEVHRLCHTTTTNAATSSLFTVLRSHSSNFGVGLPIEPILFSDHDSEVKLGAFILASARYQNGLVAMIYGNHAMPRSTSSFEKAVVFARHSASAFQTPKSAR
jgi:hypothetical protein